MRIVKSISLMRSLINKAKSRNKRIGLVPTMGALHQGHLSLIRKCRKENGLSVLSIFVNPAQFGPGEDYRVYPRNKKKDVLLAKRENVDIIFYPSVKDIYPDRYLTYIDVKNITNSLCGKSRPGHFRGVTTVVGKLLNIVSADTLYLGQKDAQQCVVIKQMIRDLNFPAVLKILPTKRESDGLAISSRNTHLSRHQRRQVAVIYQSLCAARKKISQGIRRTTLITKLIRTGIQKGSSGKIEYIACVDADTLKPLKTFKSRVLIAVAVKFGQTRLIDNIIVRCTA